MLLVLKTTHIVTLQSWMEEPPKFLLKWSRATKTEPSTGFQQHQQQAPEKKSNLEELMVKFIEASEKRFTQIETTMMSQGTSIRNLEASIHNLENQVGQMAKTLSGRQPGSIPSNTEINPREQVHAIFVGEGGHVDVREEGVLKEAPEKSAEMKAIGLEPKQVLREYKPRLPYPPSLYRRKAAGEVTDQPQPVKELKCRALNLVAKLEPPTINLDDESSTTWKSELPAKLKDPGSFFIPLTIGSLNINDALADLGASVNVMSFDLFRKLDLGEPTPTRMPVQLADRSIVHPRGIVENVLVRVGDLTFPVDFMILDMMCNLETPLILGRPFLATSRSIVDVHDRVLTLRVGADKVEIKDSKVKNHSDSHCTAKVVLSEMVQVPIKKDPIDAPKVQETVPKVKKKRRRTRKRKAKSKECESPPPQVKSTAMCHFI